MYQAKAAGRNTLRFFDPEMQAVVNQRAVLEIQLRRAIDHDELVLFYQAQVNKQGQCVGVEALVRWNHPQRGLVAPGEFIGLAEETGLIVPLGHWVLARACAQLSRWSQDSATAGLTMAVNVSARQFRAAEFVDQVLAVVQETGIRTQRLKLELTESMLLESTDDIVGKMQTLRGHGIGFSLDDFGTGYSSLSYLKRLPIDQLKIDQSFVRDVLTDPNDASIAQTIIALAHSLDLAVIAEGVETQGQRLFLEERGCDLFQGYLFGRPVSIAELEGWLNQRKGLI
jgi:EAL domain-containing protein (putative c-di-GMP-specific phosphodiesterase class I)